LKHVAVARRDGETFSKNLMQGARQHSPHPNWMKQMSSNSTTKTSAVKSVIKRPPFSPANLIEMLHSKCTGFEIGEVDWLTNASDHASMMAYNLVELTTGIARLVSKDGCDLGRPSSGGLQDRDAITALLYHIGNTAEIIAVLAKIGSDAQTELTLEAQKTGIRHD
jgi:hypothetical protein